MCRPASRLSLLLCAFTLLTGVQAVAASQWSVPAGETVRISAGQASMMLDRLEIGDGATVIVDPALGQWHVVAARVRIGKGVSILASGKPGAPGQNGQSAPAADTCADGGSGGAGGAGSAGTPGARLVFDWAIESLAGDVRIDVSGGAGGGGGAGGAGADGGRLTACDDTAGGDGGAGGQGGDGGEAGRLHLTLRSLGTEPVPFLRDHFQVLAEGGKPGTGGAAGAAGKGSEGHYVTRKTLAGDRRWIAGGDAGKQGAAGADGVTGRVGLVEIVDAAAARMSAVAPVAATAVTSGAGSLESQLQALRADIARLSARVEALEKRNRGK